MRKYILKLTAFVLALALPFALFIGAMFFVPDRFTGTLPGTLHYKIDLLQNTPGRRIIFAGGSASPYGIVCRDVEQATGRPTLCIGVTAYLGLDYYLKLLDRHARAGDTVVLMLENLLLRDVGTDYMVLWQAIGTDPDAWAAVPWAQWPGLTATAFRYGLQRIPEGWSPLRAGLRLARYDTETEMGPHDPDFGPRGDVTLPRTALLASGYNTQDLIYLHGGAASEKALKMLQRFIARMQGRGVQVLFAHAPLDALCLTSDQNQNAAYGAAVEAALGVPVLVPMEEAVMPGEYFYDSNNHLTSEGAALYTARLLPRLLAQLRE